MITRKKFHLMMRILDMRAEKGFPAVIQERCPGGTGQGHPGVVWGQRGGTALSV